MDAEITVYKGRLVLEAYGGCTVVPWPRQNLGVSPEALEWIQAALVSPSDWTGDGYVEWTEMEFNWPGGEAIKVWRSPDAFVLHPAVGLDLTRCVTVDNVTSEAAKAAVDGVNIRAREIAGYIVMHTSYDYNDEYYSEYEMGGGNPGHTLFLTEEEAAARALSANRLHVTEVLRNIRGWTFGEGLTDSHWKDDVRDEDLRRFAGLLGMPDAESASMERVVEAIGTAECVERMFTDEDLDFMIKLCPVFSTAWVETLYKA
jgi:hypothetical protein